VLRRPRDLDRLAIDVAGMRERIAAQHKNPAFWDIKHRRGGLVDAEFAAQYLMLRHARETPEAVRANTSAAFAALAASGHLHGAAADALVAALRLWRQVQGVLKLVLADGVEEEGLPPALKSVLVRGADAVDFAALKSDMTKAARRVHAQYRAIVEDAAAAARQHLPDLEQESPR
jgi:glutamate-ammonia-ligase adenylyltransferase